MKTLIFTVVFSLLVFSNSTYSNEAFKKGTKLISGGLHLGKDGLIIDPSFYYFFNGHITAGAVTDFYYRLGNQYYYYHYGLGPGVRYYAFSETTGYYLGVILVFLRAEIYDESEELKEGLSYHKWKFALGFDRFIAKNITVGPAIKVSSLVYRGYTDWDIYLKIGIAAYIF